MELACSGEELGEDGGISAQLHDHAVDGSQVQGVGSY